jgi:hypothetical protein
MLRELELSFHPERRFRSGFVDGVSFATEALPVFVDPVR